MSGRNFEVKVERQGQDGCLVKPCGFLDLDTCEDLDRAFTEMIAENRVQIAVDLSGIDFISSSGFGVFIEALGMVRELGGSLRFINPSPRARDAFGLLGVLMDCCEFE